MLDWSSSSLEHARETQELVGWSDAELLDRMLTVLGSGAIPDLNRERDRLLEEYDALPPGTPVTARIEHLARVLPPLSGPWATVFLADLLRRAGQSPAARSGPAGARPSRRTPAYDARADWRRGLLLMLATWLVLVVIAVAWVWLRP